MKKWNIYNLVERTKYLHREGLTFLETRSHMRAVVIPAVALFLLSSHLEFRYFEVEIQGFPDYPPLTDNVL